MPKPKEQPVLQETIGPTRETKRHGDYVKPETRGATVVFTNLHAAVLGKLAAHRSITRRQHAAGLCFQETYWKVWGSPSPSRDSTILPIGGVIHETDNQAERMAKNRARLNTILNRVGPRAYSVLVSVCAFNESIGRDQGRNARVFKALRDGLDQTAIAYGIANEEGA